MEKEYQTKLSLFQIPNFAESWTSKMVVV
jgi:hypothetical protein